MKNMKKIVVTSLAFGLTLSISAPAFAAETTQPDNSTTPTSEVNLKSQLLKADSGSMSEQGIVTAKTGVTFESGDTVTASDFLNNSDAPEVGMIQFKNGNTNPPETKIPGNYTFTYFVIFRDGSGLEVPVNYTVTAMPPYATLTSTPTLAQDSTPTLSQFATPENGATLSFKSTPSTSATGTFSTIIVATKDGKTQEYTASYKVVDQTPPVLKVIDKDAVFTKGESLSADDLATATDNSGKVTLSFKAGHEATTSTTGQHEAIIVATDEAGNTAELTVSYFVVNSVATLKTPTINETSSTASTVYGNTSPNVTVEMFNKAGDVIATTTSDAKGDFTFNLKTPFKNNDEFSLIAYDDNGNYSEEASFVYVGKVIDEPVVNPNKPVVKPTVKTNPTVKSNSTKETTHKSNSTYTSKKSLPKTGDESSLPLAAIGILLSSGALILLRKKHA
ncbi:LPXTG cell wall anchor domain-containing protein [Listeria sp. FSL L7-0993]|uniref:LPXTG cell wall anchor domain-containing protein n=1 Tax=Listeria cossartiae TaxID=2838249 RepID=UPI0016238C7A|nr:LPXTG cell wall anchor domain-containing protein [Listeria cossartiae]MBC1806677.1 LPXTG cell wall anchor domain-containing protein [Listeria cossartiae subsp. cayugensis]